MLARNRDRAVTDNRRAPTLVFGKRRVPGAYRCYSRRFLLLLPISSVLACADARTPVNRANPPDAAGMPDRVEVLEFGPGVLHTTSNDSWGGDGVLSFPMVLSPSLASAEFHILGLDLSGIRYTGDMGWPPDSSDTGALVEIALPGPGEVLFRFYSSLDGRDTLWNGYRIASDGYPLYRAYRVEARDREGLFARHQFATEGWGENRDREFDSFDLRIRHDGMSVSAWTRLRSSWSRENGEWHSSRPCPQNPALNTAVSGTVDSVWIGECAQGIGGEPLARGAWIPIGMKTFPDGQRVHSTSLEIRIRNWRYARGPYHVAWDDVIGIGVDDIGEAVVVGRAELEHVSLGELMEQVATGPRAIVALRAMPADAYRTASAHLRFTSGAFELTATSRDLVRSDPSRLSFAGPAVLNGQSGYRVDAVLDRGADGDHDVFRLQVFSAGGGNAVPVYSSVGRVRAGAIILP